MGARTGRRAGRGQRRPGGRQRVHGGRPPADRRAGPPARLRRANHRPLRIRQGRGLCDLHESPVSAAADLLITVASTTKDPHPMNDSQLNRPSSAAATGRYLPVLLLLFVGSGCAALIYEIVWLQMLQLVIGSNGISLGVLLGTFMGGMCLGSLLFPRLVSAKLHPLNVYAALELGIAAIGIGLIFGMPYLDDIYA